MDLIDRFSPDLEEGGLSPHQIASLLFAARKGRFGDTNAKRRARIISQLKLSSAEEAQLDSLIAKVNVFTNEVEFAAFVYGIEKSLDGYKSRHMSKREALDNLGL